VVVIGGRTERRHGDGRHRQWPPGQFVLEASFLNFSIMRFVGDKDERGKALSANVERGAGIFLFNFHPPDIDRTVYIARWHTYHHHQLVFL